MTKKLLTQVGFTKDANQAFIRFSENEEIRLRVLEFGETLNLKFDTTKRHCTGWFNPNTGENHVCPNRADVETKYEQCKECMAKTGFNPSFYNADSISANQEEYNTHPHILYLAYFSPNDIKVGISHSGRNLSRLLEQGARLAYILDTFPSANVARHYEARISRLDGIVDNVKLGRKLELLNQSFDSKEAETLLKSKKQFIEEQIQINFSANQLILTQDYFFAPTFKIEQLRQAINVADQAKIAGKFVGMLGQILLCEQDDNLLALPLKKLVGYYFEESADDTAIELPPAQFSLF